MAKSSAGSASTVREKITRVLKPAGSKSATVRYLSKEIGASMSAVHTELEAMTRAGLIKSRRLRSGETLFRLRDRFDSAWERQNGLSLPLLNQQA